MFARPSIFLCFKVKSTSLLSSPTKINGVQISTQNKKYYPKFEKIQVIDGYNEEVVKFDSTQPMSFSLTVDDYAPENYEVNSIFGGHNGVVFYSGIDRDNNNNYKVSGYSTEGVKYYLIDKTKLESILKSAYEINIGIDVTFSGINTNDFFAKNNIGKSGWQGLHTILKSNGTSIDVTDTLYKSFNTGNAVTEEKNNSEYNIVVGIYDDYTNLSEEDLETELAAPFSVLKMHNNRFSIVKFYKI